MDEQSLRVILGGVGIRLPRRANKKGWLEFPCPLAPFTHENGHDSRPSAAAKISPEGISSFVCKACHHHGRISKLVRLLADFRQDDTIRPLMLQADKADTQARIEAPLPAWEQIAEQEPPPEPLVEEAYHGIYPPACDSRIAVAYLKGRGMNRETTEFLGLLFDDGEGRVLFPVRDRTGALYGFTGRAVDPGVKPKVKDYFGLPKRHLILGEELWRDGMPKIIVEGLFAYAHLHRIGVYEVADIGALLGSAMTREKAERIIHANDPTYLLLDNDQGGDIGLFGTLLPEGGREENGAVHYLQGHVPIFVPDWPEGKDDPDQLTREEVDFMLAETPLFGPDGQNPFDKRWEAWV